MAQERWALRPGEKTLSEAYMSLQQESLDKKYDKLVDEYVSKMDRRPLVLNDNKEIVYFITYKTKSEFDEVDVALYDGNAYHYLPEELALESVQAYMAYIEVIGKAYEHATTKQEGGSL